MLTDETRQALLEAALTARQNAYAPYSNYAVGAALLSENGQVYTGCNVENASYGLANCAERTAIFKMVSEGHQRMLAIAIATENGGSPCGACRQVMVEFAADIPVLLTDSAGNVVETTLYKLIPHHFGPEHLP